MLAIVRRCKWWRRIPGWHRREAEFRDWYTGLLDRIDLSSPSGYEQALTVLRCPEQVNGYREVRYPKMDLARKETETTLSAKLPPAAPKLQILMRSVNSTTSVS